MATSATARQMDATATANSLMERVKAGDEQAFNELYKNNYERVISAVGRYINEPDIAEHIANGVFAKVWQVRNTGSGFKGDSSFSTWLTRIAYNEALMYLRRTRAERNAIAFSLDENVDTNSGTVKVDFSAHDMYLEGIFERRELAQAIAKLPAVYRTVFMLRMVEGLTNEEVCEQLNLGITVVKSRLFRSRRMMMDILAQNKIATNKVVKSAATVV